MCLNSHFSSPSVLPLVMESSISIFEHFSKLRAPSDHIVALLAKSSLLTLCAVAKLDAVTEEESSWKSQKRREIFGKLQLGLQAWIVDKNVIGGNMFGGSVPGYGSGISQWKDTSKTELQVGAIVNSQVFIHPPHYTRFGIHCF